MTATTLIRSGLGVLGLAALTVAAWFAWLGWDTRYDIDPITHNSSGPYEAWQVVGCVLSVAAISFVSGRTINPLLVVPTVTLAFTAAWSLQAAATDDSGLWPVGAILVLVGMAVWSTALSVVGWVARTRQPPAGSFPVPNHYA
jgi:hypothetical protein